MTLSTGGKYNWEIKYDWYNVIQYEPLPIIQALINCIILYEHMPINQLNKLLPFLITLQSFFSSFTEFQTCIMCKANINI